MICQSSAGDLSRFEYSKYYSAASKNSKGVLEETIKVVQVRYREHLKNKRIEASAHQMPSQEKSNGSDEVQQGSKSNRS